MADETDNPTRDEAPEGAAPEPEAPRDGAPESSPEAAADAESGSEGHVPSLDLEPDLSLFGSGNEVEEDEKDEAQADTASLDALAGDEDGTVNLETDEDEPVAFQLPPDLFTKSGRGRIPWQATLLVGNTVVLAVLALVLLLRPQNGPSHVAVERMLPPSPSAPAGTSDQSPIPAANDSLPEAKGAVSWAVAEDHYASEQYGLAIGYYRRLLETSLLNPREWMISDFCRLRIAQCQVHLDRLPEAHDVLRSLASSRSPVVRGTALYLSATLNAAEGQYLSAWIQSYQALGALGAAEGASDLRTQCNLLAAEAMTRKGLAFFNSDESLPRRREPPADPLAGMKTEEGLREKLAAGVQRMSDAAIGPRLASADRGGIGRLWTVTSAGAPLEEFLHRLVGESGLNIRWHEVGRAGRRRPLTLALTDVKDVRVVEVACGSVGLVARLTGEEAIIHDPSGRTSTDELRDLVLREAVSGWRRVLLRAPDAKRQAYGHFALGLLYEHQNDHASAITEYRLVTERYPRSKHAPRARLRGAIVRIDFRDFTGAREELIELLNRHPSFPDSDQVYLRLGQATMETGHLDEAIKTFKKLFYLELSQESRIGACLGAGTCFYRKGDHKSAAEWLARYVALARQSEREAGAARGSLLLARSLNALGRHQDAVAAVRKAADVEADTDLRTALLLELARSLAAGKEYTAALAVLHRVEDSDVDRPALDEAALIQSRVLRAISVPERALRLLREELRHAADARTKARMAVELARCYADAGDLDGARRIMAEALPKLEAGPEAHEATCELADFALRAGHPEQTIGLCRKLLARPISPEVRRRAFDALGQAYVAVRDYERAALAFSGAMPGAKGATNP